MAAKSDNFMDAQIKAADKLKEEMKKATSKKK